LDPSLLDRTRQAALCNDLRADALLIHVRNLLDANTTQEKSLNRIVYK